MTDAGHDQVKYRPMEGCDRNCACSAKGGCGSSFVCSQPRGYAPPIRNSALILQRQMRPGAHEVCTQENGQSESTN